MATIYEHNGKELFKDEADAYEIEDIRTHYAQFNKELLSATYTVIPAEKEGEPRKVVFAKKTGTKGGQDPIIAALLSVPPARPEAFGLLAELLSDPEKLTPEILLFKGAEIWAAENDLWELASRSHLAVQRVLQLKPAPAPFVPAGF
ncbi:MAG: hypothetical protein BroJett011_62530 [Chloroflexota bacterium]|nr:MAG: hypothetical protein BroJett011_62530 [Chloroflexota bacterium]